MPSKPEMQRSIDRMELRWREAQEKVDAAEQWCRDMLDRHQPYVLGRIDVSVSSHEDLREDFLDQLGRNVYCSECRIPFPCRNVANLRTLRALLRTGEYGGLPTEATAVSSPVIETAL